jgi:hypothetical protein
VDKRIHFGLGDASLIDTLIVEWPSGITEAWYDIEANQELLLMEGDGTPLSVQRQPHHQPTEMLLSQAWPNPFNSGTMVQVSLPSAAPVQAHVYDLQGRIVRTLADVTLTAGTHRIHWDGRSNALTPVASGSYFLQLQTDNRVLTRRVTLVR